MLPYRIGILKSPIPNDKIIFKDILLGKNTLYGRLSLHFLRIPPLSKCERELERQREQIYVILKGEGKIVFKEYKTISIERGDIIYIPPAYSHTIINAADYEMDILIIRAPP